jgi:hydrogenase nickel incorporation protein HypA/HybF
VHELGIAQQIVELACEGAAGARVTRIVVAIGKLSMVLPDALDFCFDLATERTAAEGAKLEIIETPGMARCRACAAAVALDRPFGRCTCGSTDLDWTSGEELEIREVEVV